jgi:DNA (cytosine-5)-methyltransferase 1
VKFDGIADTVNANGGGGVVQAYNVNAAESCAKRDHAIETETARCLDTSGGFTTQQGGTVVAFQETGRGWWNESPEAATLRVPNGSGSLQANVVCATGEQTHTLRADGFDASEDGTGRGTPIVVCHMQGLGNHEQNKIDASDLLRGVRETVGEEALSRWGLGVLEQLLPPEVLRQALHGNELRPAAFSRNWLVDCSLSRAEDRGARAVQSLREARCEGHPPQGWKLSEQRAQQLGAYLSELSQPGPQSEGFMLDLWQASEGLRALRQALSAIQDARRSASREDQPEHTSVMVRRLTPTECEFLMGMPRNYTLITRHTGKPAADGPRYRALGNSMAVPVMRWIGERIESVDQLLAGFING